MINNLVTLCQMLFVIICAMVVRKERTKCLIIKHILNPLVPSDFHGLKSELAALILNPASEAVPKPETTASRKTRTPLNMEPGSPTAKDSAMTS